MAHTPAPWIACNVGDYGDYDGRCRVILGDDLRIAVTLGDHDEGDANARLIAAAPCLLEALERCLNFIENTEGEMGETLPCGERARAAIARAKGGDT
jgi:ABC-type transport system involved in cytochrome bd biosynthesis fused ATPase/permease subunit